MNGWTWRGGGEMPAGGGPEREFVVEAEASYGQARRRVRCLARWDGVGFVCSDSGEPIPGREPSEVKVRITRWAEIPP